MRASPKSAVATIIVGQNDSAETFFLHGDLLTKRSGFFAAALGNKRWVESQQMVVRLPEDDPKLFDIFAKFLYCTKIYSTEPDDKKAETEDMTYADPEWERLARCWVLGDKLNCPWFQDASIDAIVQRMVETGETPIALHTFAYTKTAGDNALKRLAVDIATWRYEKEDLTDEDLTNPELAEFFRDTFRRLHERCGMKESSSSDGPDHEPWSDGPRCLYHVHCFGVDYHCYDISVVLGGGL